MTGFRSKQAAVQAKLNDDDDIQEYKREWVGLTDAVIDNIRFSITATHHTEFDRKFARAIEQLLKEKNT